MADPMPPGVRSRATPGKGVNGDAPADSTARAAGAGGPGIAKAGADPAGASADATAPLAELLRSARAALAGGSDSPQLDAELLLAQLLGKPRSFLYAWPDHRPTASLAERFRADIAARAAGQPVAYTLGVKEFFGLELKVTPSVLIPRPETELLVEEALERIAPEQAARVADLGTGSGAVALAIACHRRHARVLATDRSAEALAVARANAAAHGLSVDFARMDWCQGLAPASCDLLVANPPYIAEGDPHLDALAAEPRTALVAGSDGLAALRSIVRAAPRVLRPGGWLLVEHGFDQRDAVARLLVDAGLTKRACQEDLSGQPRVSLGQMPS